MGAIDKIYQSLMKMFVRNYKRFPAGKELDDLVNQAKQVFDGALEYNVNQAKGKNLDDIEIMKGTTEKNGDQLIDDYLSGQAEKASQQNPTFTVVEEKKLPKADIEALPLADKEKAEAAVKKKIEAQNIQAKQSIEGGESSGGQRGAPELVDENYNSTVYIDLGEMNILMDDAMRKFDQAADAAARGDYDDARAILRYEIEDNYKLPQATRDAAYDARIFIRRGEGLAKDMGYDTEEEILEALNDKIAEGVQTTYKDNWPTFTGRDETGDFKNIEYVDYLSEAGEDFGTPNSQIINPEDIDYNFANGGRVGMKKGGGLLNILKKIFPKSDLSDASDLIEQAKKAGIEIETLKDFENFQKQVQEASNKIYESRKKFPGVEGEKSGLPVDDKNLVPKTNLKKVREQKKAFDETEKELAKEGQIPVRDDTVKKSEYKFTGRETQDDLYELEEKGIISRADHNVYGDRYLDYLDAKVKYYYGYTKGQMNKIKNQPARLNYLRAQVDPNWGEANFGEDYLRILEKARGEEIKITNPGKDKSGPFDHIFEKMYKPVRDEIDEADKIPGEEPLTPAPKKTPRKDNAKGGLNYLLGF